jgi:hypothetical protein
VVSLIQVMQHKSPFSLDRTAVRLTTHEEQGTDLAYWLTRTPQERLAALEFLRQQQYDGPAPRLQRVLRFIERA